MLTIFLLLILLTCLLSYVFSQYLGLLLYLLTYFDAQIFKALNCIVGVVASKLSWIFYIEHLEVQIFEKVPLR